MENNNVYNILNQIAQESKSLWRIKNHYVKEAPSDDEKAFWETLAQSKESLISELKQLLKQNL